MTTMSGCARRTGLLLLAAGTLLAASFAGAGGAGAAPGDLTVVRIADINPGGHSDPQEFTNVNGTVFFAAGNATSGRELWKSAPPYTTATMVANIAPGGASSDPEWLTAVGNTLFFAANDGTNGVELWKSDGTTVTMFEINDQNDDGSNPEELTDVNGTLLFAANDDVGGRELFKSDGTTATQVEDIFPAGTGSNPDFLTNVNGALLFAADDGTDRTELWKSVAPFTSGTTDQVANINPNADESSSPEDLTAIGGTVFFEANDGSNGFELWKYDGTNAPTIVGGAEGLEPGAGGSFPEDLTNVNGTLLFDAETTAEGPELFKSGSPYTSASLVGTGVRPSSTNSTQISNLTDVNGTLFFTAYDGGTVGKQGNLWKSVAPFDAVTQLPDLTPAPSDSSNTQNLVNVNGTLFFSATDAINGQELWRHDGTTATPVPDADGIVAGAGGALTDPTPSDDDPPTPARLTNVNGTLFFSADDGSGFEPWRTGIEGPPAPAAKCAGRSATKVGTAGRDVISGTPGADVIAGLGGNDIIRGRGGRDLLCGGAGGDTLRGGAGKDRLLGQAGRDKLFGGGGRDVLKGGPGRDRQRQ